MNLEFASSLAIYLSSMQNL